MSKRERTKNQIQNGTFKKEENETSNIISKRREYNFQSRRNRNNSNKIENNESNYRSKERLKSREKKEEIEEKNISNNPNSSYRRNKRLINRNSQNENLRLENKTKERINKNNSEFISQLLSVINNLRTNIKDYYNDFDKYEENIKKSYGFKENIQNDIIKLISKLKNTKINFKLQKNEKLTELAEQYLEELHFSKTRTFYPKDHDELLNDLNSEFKNVKFCKNYISTKEEPLKIIFELLFNEKDVLNGTSDRLLNPESKYIGISHEKIRNIPITIIIVCDSNIEIDQESLFDGLLNEINKARNHPQSYLKYINESNENYKKILNGKKYCKLEYNSLLENAAEERGKIFDEENEFYDRKKLNKFLSNYGRNYFIIYEYIDNSTLTSRDFVINMLQKENIDQILLNRRIKQIGFSQSQNGKVILLFSDAFDKKLDHKEITIETIKRKINRPNFTEDEILQIKNDFNLFDSQSSGLIKPNIILLIANKNKDWGNKNPFYYTALKELNTEENNLNGINVDQFINAVKRVIREYNIEDFDNNWSEIYNLYFVEGKKNNIIDNDILINLIKDLGFKISDDEINEYVEKMDGDLNLEKFIEIMKNIELKNRK